VDLDLVDIVLVRPARAGNVAAACRAMKNMGLRHLRLVAATPIGSDDRGLAYGAWDVLDAASHHTELAEAVAPATFVAGTSGRAGEAAWSPRRLAEEGAARAGGGRIAIVFGPERTGLAREELQLCHALVHAPTDAAHSSLNLAQAVLLVAYELRLHAAPGAPAIEDDRATSGELEACLAALKSGLLTVGFLNPEEPDRILAELRGLLARAAPTRRELTLLRGIARQVEWAGSVASRARRSG
jgi:TrmH family RNA methyltransferase